MHLNICQIESALFMSLIKKLGYELFIVSITNIKKILRSKKYTNSVKKVLKKYYKFLNIFFQKEADKLSKHYLYDYKIELESRKQLLFESIYEIFLDKLKCLQKYLNKHLAKDFIRASKLLVAAFVLFAKKSEEDLQFYVNY